MYNKVECDMKYRRSKRGVITQNYSMQLKSSRDRNMDAPNYSNKELQIWANSQDIFHKLYADWINNDYISFKRPSFDRKNDYRPYTLDNLQIMTWEENANKGHSDKFKGINTKNSKTIQQFTLNGTFIKEFPSVRIAARELGKSHGNISMTARGKYKSAYGFIWKYKE